MESNIERSEKTPQAFASGNDIRERDREIDKKKEGKRERFSSGQIKRHNWAICRCGKSWGKYRESRKGTAT